MTSLREFIDTLSADALVERLRLALEGSDLGIWDWDLRDDSVQFDRRWCEMLGLDPATTPMELKTWASRVHPDDIQACYADIRAHIEGRTPRYENVHRMRHADGSWVYILDRGRISGRDPDGRPIRFTGTHSDVTERELARQVLARQERQLEELVASLPVGVAMFDRDLRFIAVSPQWARHQDVDAAGLVGELLEVALPALAARWGEALRRALVGERVAADEERVAGPDGGDRWLHWDVRPWRTLDGAVGGALFTTEDVTERVLLRQAEERERDARFASLAIFAGGIAHEINSPLQVILTESELASMELDAEAPDLGELRRGVAAIRATAGRAAAITRALRTLSRDARRDPPATISLAALFRDAEALCRARLASAGVGLTVVSPPPGLAVTGRSAELLHAILNLLNNAADAAVEGEPWVRLEAEGGDGRAVIRCVDGGPGVAPEHRARLAEPFFTTKPEGRGTGLGLSIVRRLAERNGGFLRFAADAPHTTFELDLPIAEGG